MLAFLFKKYAFQYAAKLLRTTTTAVGTSVYQAVLGIGFIIAGLAGGFVGVMLGLGVLFLYLANLQFVGSVLIIALIVFGASIVSIAIGTSKLKRK